MDSVLNVLCIYELSHALFLSGSSLYAVFHQPDVIWRLIRIMSIVNFYFLPVNTTTLFSSDGVVV